MPPSAGAGGGLRLIGQRLGNRLSARSTPLLANWVISAASSSKAPLGALSFWPENLQGAGGSAAACRSWRSSSLSSTCCSG